MKVLTWPPIDRPLGNPYTKLLYDRVESLGFRVDNLTLHRSILNRYDVLHLHWPEYYIAHPKPLRAAVGTLRLLSLVLWLRLRGTKIVWTVHNVASHNRVRPRMENCFWKFLTRRLDGYIALAESGKVEAQKRYLPLRALPAFVIPHGHYRDAYPNEIGRSDARCRLGVTSNAKMILFFGSIRPYKNVHFLIKTFRQVVDSEATLVIAGSAGNGVNERAIIEEAGQDRRIKLRLTFVPREEVQVYFRACDLVVLPFLEIFNSGSALLALSFDRPVLVPHLGALPELAKSVGRNWIRTYSGDLNVTILRDALSWATAAGARGERAPLDALNWDCIGNMTVDAYRALCKRPSHNERAVLPRFMGSSMGRTNL